MGETIQGRQGVGDFGQGLLSMVWAVAVGCLPALLLFLEQALDHLVFVAHGWVRSRFGCFRVGVCGRYGKYSGLGWFVNLLVLLCYLC